MIIMFIIVLLSADIDHMLLSAERFFNSHVFMNQANGNPLEKISPIIL